MMSDMSLRGRAQHFVAAVTDAIRREPDFDRAMTLSVWLGRYLWSNFCGIYRIDELEHILLSKMQMPDVGVGAHHAKRRELHVASAVYPNGGHTLLMKSLMAQAKLLPDVLLTRPVCRQEAARILATAPENVDVPEASLPTRAQIFQWARKMAGYETVVLHVHPDDMSAALAVRWAKRINPDLFVGFMNHADHAFSVAVGAADKVFEISAYGWALRDRRGTEGRSTFVGIPISPANARPQGGGQGGFALSGGAAYKYKPFRGQSLPMVLGQLIKRDRRIRLVIIGPKSKDYWWWPLRLVAGRRLELLKPVHREAYFQLLSDCTFYIDSYPWPGGTAFPEALMRGGNVAGLHGGSSGYSYADLLRSESVDVFLDTCVKLAAGDPDVLRRQAEVREHCIAFHSPASVRQRMEAGFQLNYIELPPSEMLEHKQAASAELDWIDSGRSITPSLTSLELDKVSKSLLLRLHVTHFGWFWHSTLKLAFDFYLKKRKG